MVSDIIVLDRGLLASSAFRSLKGVATLVYLDFLGKRKMKKIGKLKTLTILNNGEITYYYSEAEKRGITRPRFQRAIDELIKKGFIDLFHQGAGYHRGADFQRDKNLYAISERWRKWGTHNFIKKARTKDTREGKGFKEVWRRKGSKVSNANVTYISNKNITCDHGAEKLEKII